MDMRNVTLEVRISPQELRTRLKLNRVNKCLQDKRLHLLGRLETMEEFKFLVQYMQTVRTKWPYSQLMVMVNVGDI